MSKEMLGNKLKLALSNLNSLPVMPAIAQKLLALQLDTEEGEAQMLKLIEQDLQLFARIIGLANSSAVGAGRKINSLGDAAMLLGIKRLKSVAVGIATMSKMLNQPAGKNFDPHDLWTHCMTVAVVMNTISQAMPKRLRPDDNQIFLAGLLHDIGLMALHYLDPEASDELHRQLRLHPRCPISELELELLGMTHGYIGAQLVRHWNLPEDIVEVVALHHEQDLGQVSLANPLVRMVNIAEKLLPDFGLAEHTLDAIKESDWAELCIAPSCEEELSLLANELAMQLVQLPQAHEKARPSANAATEIASGVAARRTVFAAAPRASSPAARQSPIRALIAWIARLFG